MQIFANTDPGWESTKIPAVLDFPVRLASPTNKNLRFLDSPVALDSLEFLFISRDC